MQIVDGTPYIEQVKRLLFEYTNALGRDLAFQHLEEELLDPTSKYTLPAGELLVACEKDTVWGMVAYHRHSEQRCEMKRLYVHPKRRGQHVGEKLIAQILNRAKRAGYKEIVLDTLQSMKSAVCLYQKYGFQACEPYYENPFADAIYMKKEL